MESTAVKITTSGQCEGGGVRAVKVRSGAPCYLAKKSPSSLQCYRFGPWAIAGQGEYPRRTGRNGHGLRDPPGNYGLSCPINTSKKLQKNTHRRRVSEPKGKHLYHGTPLRLAHLTHPAFNPMSPTTHSINASFARGDTKMSAGVELLQKQKGKRGK